MNLDLLSDILADNQPLGTGSLLSNLPNRGLTIGNQGPHDLSDSQFLGSIHAGVALSKIEDIFEAIADCLLDGKNEMAIRLKTRKKSTTNSHTGDENSGRDQMRAVRFPSKNPQEAWKFTVLLRILSVSHEALATGTIVTKRDIYYRDPELFMKQAVVDRYVDDIAYTFGVQRDALNVVAAAKGLVAGAFSITRGDGSVVDYRSGLEGLLVPNAKDIRAIQLQEVQWILVIEKEASFRTLSAAQYWKSSPAGRGVIITAKGYPDIQSRQFLYFISTQAPCIPIYCVVDFDPDGIGIVSTYKYGSMALAHENATLAVPSVQWLGIRSCDVLQEKADKGGLLKLSKRDRRLAMKMLEKDIFREHHWHGEAGWRRELQVMLMLNLKAEIQVLSPNEVRLEGLEGWLDGKLQRNMIQL